MLRFWVLFLVLLTAGLAQDPQRMDEVVRAQAAGNHFMGAVLVAKDGTILFDRAYGLANVEWQVSNTTDTRFRLGSITKQFTAAAILLLEERGKLGTDDPLSKFIPDLPATWQQITLRQLLNHTSGIPAFDKWPDLATLRRSPLELEKGLKRLREQPLEFAPGEKFSYSNSGYLMLGHIIEIVTGQKYGVFVHEQILVPLGLTDTDPDSNTAIIPRRASGYMLAKGQLQNAPYINMEVPHAAGALYSTTHDLLHWTEALMGGRLISAASLEKMTTPGKGDYGFGLVVRTVSGRKLIEHGGTIEGFNTQMNHYPESRITVVVLANVNGPAAVKLAGQLGDLAHGDRVVLASELKEIVVPAETLRKYVGVYQLKPNLNNTVRLVDGRLTAQLSGQAAYPLFAQSDYEFFLKVVEAREEFVTDATGRVTHFLLHQNGRTQQGPRISDTVVEHVAVSLPGEALIKFVGTYELRPGFDLVIALAGDQLTGQATGQKAAPIFPETETRFFYKVIDAQIEFFTDRSGAVTHLVLHQGPSDVKGRRKS
jgi:CubicO group peptidase (beta-lactamase class C family)